MPQFAEEIRRMTIAEFDFVTGLADDREFELIDAIVFNIGLSQIYFDLPF